MRSTSPNFRLTLWVIGILLTLVLVSEAFATGKPPDSPKPDPAPVATSSSSSESAALAAARAAAAAGAVAGANSEGGAGGASDASSVADGGNARATGGDGIGTVEGDSTRVTSWGVALNVPAATAAPAWGSDCHVHSKGTAVGWGAFGRTGGTKIDPLCASRLHCLRIADRLASWGVVEGALRQLALCEGVTAEAPPLPPVVPPAAALPPIDPVPRAEFEEGMRRLEERQDRMIQRGIGK